MKSQELQTLHFTYLKQKEELGGELQEQPPCCLHGEQDIFRICSTERGSQSNRRWESPGWEVLWCAGDTGRAPHRENHPPSTPRWWGQPRQGTQSSINPHPELILEQCSPEVTWIWGVKPWLTHPRVLWTDRTRFGASSSGSCSELITPKPQDISLLTPTSL